MTIRVRFDERIFLGQRRGGVSRYFAELAREFTGDRAQGVDLLAARVPVPNHHAVDAAPTVFRPASGPVTFGRRLRGRLAPAGAYPVPRGGERPDLLHYTYYDTDWLVDDVPTVSTVHDLIHELMPETFTAGPRHMSKRTFVERSSGIVCVSETTRRDLVTVFGAPDKPTAVVPLGVGDAFRAPRSPAIPLPDSYLLFVGQRGTYKNFRLALDAFVLLRAADPGLELVCVGGLPWGDDERATIASLDAERCVTRLDVDERDLPGVYAGARALLFPSAYEGFGLPVLEAMAAGCPVLVADTAIAHEVGADAAMVTPVLTGEAIAETVAPVLPDGAARAARVQAGRLRADGFTWARTARATADFYREVLAP